MAFIDHATIQVKAGDGGDGCISFRREKFVPDGGPDGGDGGRGGNVFLQATERMQTLYDFRRKKIYQARNGQPGRGSKMSGAGGNDVLIQVPCGTIAKVQDITDPTNDVGLEQVFDLTHNNQQVLVAKGGRGGYGNTHFKSSIQQSPRIARDGKPGEEKEIYLELKLIADVGIIGLPNAGKSTLLQHLTAAKPKIADYPFTTLSPNLGVLELPDSYITLADVPGLIAGASQGTGLGHDFLRHIERTKSFIHVIDASSADPLADYHIIRSELAQYNESLLTRPEIIALNKNDLPASQEKKSLFTNFPNVFEISAASGKGLEELKKSLISMVQGHQFSLGA